MDIQHNRSVRIISIIVLCFFTWTFGGIFDIAYAIKNSDELGTVSSKTKANQKSARTNNQPQKPRPEEKFQKAMEDIEQVLTDTSLDTDKKKNRLKTKKTEIDSFDVEIKKQFAETEKKLRDEGFSGEILERHHKFVRIYDDNLKELRNNLNAIDKSKDSKEVEAKVQETKRHLEKVKPPKKHRPFDPNKLPHRTMEPVFKEPRTTPEEFIEGVVKQAKGNQQRPILVASNGSLNGLLSAANEPILLAALTPPTSADLAETIEVRLTPAIQAKAAELDHNPTKIYNWVRNNIDYVPTYGSIQGANMCLQTKQCNDFDTASLLIALLRASGIHARYVYGTIELPIEKVRNWLGGFTNSMEALRLLASARIPVKGMTEGGEIKYVRMEHVWVEAWIDYIPSRGARHKAGKGDTWIPLDASFKQYNYTQGIDIKSVVPFDAQSFINQIQSTATINETEGYVTNVNSLYIQQQMQDYQTQVQNYITQHYPNATVGDVLGKKEIIKQEFTILLGTLPYRTIARGSPYASIPDSLRHKLNFNVIKDIYDSELGTPINITKSLPELAGKKITLSYSPATAQDEAVINSYLPKPHPDGTPIQPNELPSSLPAYLINLKPELRVDGVVIATGTPVTMGNTETFKMTFTGPKESPDIITNDIEAGEYLGIALDLGRISQEQMTALKTKLEATKAKLEAGNFSELIQDDIFGDMLFITATLYNARIDGYDVVLAHSLGVTAVRVPSEAIFQTTLEVNYILGIPVRISAGGLMMDADRNISIVKSLDGNNKKNIQFMQYSGINGSTQENRVPEQLFSIANDTVGGVSAAKALQIANDSGIPIYTITKSNIDTILPILQIDASVINDIRNAVNAGKETIVSKTNVEYQGWIGCGYVIVDSSAGSAAYMISGGMSGAYIVSMLGFPPLVWSYVSMHSDSWEDVKGFIEKFVGFEITEPKDWCGSEGYEWVPDFPFGIDAQRACKNHDICYTNAPTGIDKLHCDVMLGCELFNDCIFQGNDPFLCGSVTQTYSLAVIIFGWKAWKAL